MLKRLLIAGALALGCASLAVAGQHKNAADGSVVNGNYDESYSTIVPTYAAISVATTAQTLAQMGATPPAGATLAFVVPTASGSGVTVRYRCDGTAPTASVGMPIQAGQAWPIQGAAALAACQFISATGSAVTADVEFRG